jgi:large conductance mechanosensitive channel
MPVSNKKVMKELESIKKVDQKISQQFSIVRVGKSQVKGFMDFIRSQGVIGLAVGLVLGGAVSVMVKSLIDNVVMPPLGFLLGSANGLIGLTLTMGKTHSGQAVVLRYGIFLNDLINFIIIALVVYFLVSLLRVDKIDKKK